MQSDGEVLLRAILSTVARQTFPPERLADIVLKGSGPKQLRAYNMCDGTVSQADVGKTVKLDPASMSRTVARWTEAGVVFKLGSGRDTRLLHLYPLPPDSLKRLKERSQ